jgi:hypothetical protein
MATKTARTFVTRTKKAARRRSGPTFIQRSRQESSEQKAMFHQVTGAGRSHVMRQFFGLTPAEQGIALTTLEGLIASRLAAAQR